MSELKSSKPREFKKGLGSNDSHRSPLSTKHLLTVRDSLPKYAAPSGTRNSLEYAQYPVGSFVLEQDQSGQDVFPVATCLEKGVIKDPSKSTEASYGDSGIKYGGRGMLGVDTRRFGMEIITGGSKAAEKRLSQIDEIIGRLGISRIFNIRERQYHFNEFASRHELLTATSGANAETGSRHQKADPETLSQADTLLETSSFGEYRWEQKVKGPLGMKAEVSVEASIDDNGVSQTEGKAKGKLLGVTVGKVKGEMSSSIDDNGVSQTEGKAKGKLLGVTVGKVEGEMSSSIDEYGVRKAKGKAKGKLLGVTAGKLEGKISSYRDGGGKAEAKGKLLGMTVGELNGESRIRDGVREAGGWVQAKLLGMTVGELEGKISSYENGIRWAEGKGKLLGMTVGKLKGGSYIKDGVRKAEGMVKAKLLGMTVGKVAGQVEGYINKDGVSQTEGMMEGKLLGVVKGKGSVEAFFDKNKKAFSVRGVAVLKIGNWGIGGGAKVFYEKRAIGTQGVIVVKMGKRGFTFGSSLRFGENKNEYTQHNIDSETSIDEKNGYNSEEYSIESKK